MAKKKKNQFNLDKSHEKLLAILESPYRNSFESYKIMESVRNHLKDIDNKAYERGFNEAMDLKLDSINESKKDE